MRTPIDVRASQCRVLLASPEHYAECVILVETDEALIFVLTDELRSRECLVELPGDGQGIVRRIPLSLLRSLLDQAERKLLAPPDLQ